MPLPQPSSLRDRTPEFIAVVERLQKQQGALATSAAQNGGFLGSSSSNKLDAKASVQQQSDFAKKAADIGHGIHRTSLKLQQLAQLAKRTSTFDDPTVQVEELTGMIKQDIQALNSAIAELQRISARGKEDNKQSIDHSHTVVDNLRSKLKDATQEFKDVLTVRTEYLKHHKERRQLFSSNTDPEAVPLLKQQRHGLATASSMGTSTSNGTINPTHTPTFLQTPQQQQQLMLAQPQDTYLSSRAEALRNVESTIVELGTIFQKLSDMVAQQGELTIRIDENIEDTLSNVTSAQEQLLKYLNSISSNRWLILKVFFVLLIFLVIFVMFVV